MKTTHHDIVQLDLMSVTLKIPVKMYKAQVLHFIRVYFRRVGNTVLVNVCVFVSNTSCNVLCLDLIRYRRAGLVQDSRRQLQSAEASEPRHG